MHLRARNEGLTVKSINFLKYNLATGFGVGLSPYAPGTLGSVLGLLFVWFFFPHSVLWQFVVLTGVFLIAVYTGGWLADAENVKDPSIVVVDEIIGQMITFFLIPVAALGSIKVMIVGLILFRIFDIWKPWPVNKCEDMPGGLGIVLDDVAAGIYANIILQIWLRIF